MNKNCEILCSIIIPVYNVASYLSRCLDSILRGINDYCEILLILGQSTDQSNVIAYKYSEEFKVIRVIEQKGEGLSNARNVGVEHAKGKYVTYIDSDDFVNSEKFLNCILFLQKDLKVDVLLTDFQRVLVDYNQIENVYFLLKYMTPRYATQDDLKKYLKKRHCFWNVWHYFYLREFLINNNIKFVENRNSEDVDYTTKVWLSEPEMYFWHNPYYYYQVGRKESLMGQVDLKRIEDTIYTLEASISAIENSAQKAYSMLMAEQFRKEYILNISLIDEVEKDKRVLAIELFENWGKILSCSQSFSGCCAFFLIKKLGFFKVSIILHKIKNIKKSLRNFWFMIRYF